MRICFPIFGIQWFEMRNHTFNWHYVYCIYAALPYQFICVCFHFHHVVFFLLIWNIFYIEYIKALFWNCSIYDRWDGDRDSKRRTKKHTHKYNERKSQEFAKSASTQMNAYSDSNYKIRDACIIIMMMIKCDDFIHWMIHSDHIVNGATRERM